MKVTGFTLDFLDVGPGAEAELNRWCDTDHVPETFALPGYYGVRRYVATVQDQALRFPTKHPDFRDIAATYLTTCLLSADDLQRAQLIMPDLETRPPLEHRMYRRVRPSNVHTYRVAKAFTRRGLARPSRGPGPQDGPERGHGRPRWRAGGPLLSPAAVLHIGHLGVYVALCDPAPGQAAETEAWYDRVHIPEMLQVKGFAAGVRLVRELPEQDGRFANLFFLDDNPVDAVRDLNEHIRRWRREKRLPFQAVGARTAFSSGFHLITQSEFAFINGRSSQGRGTHMPAKLSDERIKAKLKSVPGWRRAGGKIKKRYAFDDFVKALRFVNKVGKLAEEMDHHPDITINYDKVTLGLSTHSAGGITDLDFGLAGKIEGVAPKAKGKKA